MRGSERDRFRGIVEGVLEQLLRSFVVERGNGKHEVAPRRFRQSAKLVARAARPIGRYCKRGFVSRPFHTRAPWRKYCVGTYEHSENEDERENDGSAGHPLPVLA